MIHRRWLQFSLRGLLVAVTVGCVWLGWKVERARKQREAVKAIEAAGGVVQYDWQGDADAWIVNRNPQPRSPQWLRWIFGNVCNVTFIAGNMPHGKRQAQLGTEIRAVVPELQALPRLRVVYLVDLSQTLVNDLKIALPYCRISRQESIAHFLHQLREQPAPHR